MTVRKLMVVRRKRTVTRRWRGLRRVVRRPRARKARPACCWVVDVEVAAAAVASFLLRTKSWPINAMPRAASTRGVVRRLTRSSQVVVRITKGKRMVKRRRLMTRVPSFATMPLVAGGRRGRKGLTPVPLSAHLVNFYYRGMCVMMVSV